MPEIYGDLAKRVYAMSEKVGWTKEKTFQLLKSPNKLIANMENRKVQGYEKEIDPVILCMIDDQKIKEKQLDDQKKAAEESEIMN